jgi:probable F420-dependent oxidoreductase
MRIGAVYPQTELGGDPEAVRRIGQGVEQLGFDHLLVYDHVLGAVQTDRDPPLVGPYDQHDPFHDPLVMFAYLAGLTERIELVTGILVLPQRQTALVARQAADVDLLSSGRLRLGVGVGWNHVEYEALGQDFHTRGKRQEEQIELLRRLWTESVVEHLGRFDVVDRAGLVPRPTRQIPIWLGGFGSAAFERAARLADGFIFSGRAAGSAEPWERVQGFLREHRRPVEEFGAEQMISARGGPQEVAERARAWEALGGTHASFSTLGMGLDSAEAHLDQLAATAAALGLPSA